MVEDSICYWICEGVLKWAEDEPQFDTSFVRSLRGYVIERGGLSQKQKNALFNVVVSNFINIDKFCNEARGVTNDKAGTTYGQFSPRGGEG